MLITMRIREPHVGDAVTTIGVARGRPCRVIIEETVRNGPEVINNGNRTELVC